MTRKRQARSGEGALGDGRRPEPANADVFDETAAEPGTAARGDGDAAAMPDPPRGATEGVRGYVTSSARGRKDRDREVQRGGAVDRGSARTALHSTRTPRGSRDGCGEDRSWRFAVKRSSTWQAHPTKRLDELPARRPPGPRWGRPPTVQPRVNRRTRVARRRKTERGAIHDATRNRTVRRVLVKGVGCRSRRDASFS